MLAMPESVNHIIRINDPLLLTFRPSFKRPPARQSVMDPCNRTERQYAQWLLAELSAELTTQTCVRLNELAFMRYSLKLTVVSEMDWTELAAHCQR